MRCDQGELEPRSRRHVIRLAALLGASVAAGITFGKKARAAGRHSNPFFCEPACLLRGTLIETAAGENAIENIMVGDLIRTVEGGFQEVVWIGRQVLTRRSGEAWDSSVEPVLIMDSAIAPGVPTQDVYVSPAHALFCDGYLIPAKFLINGLTIRQRHFDSDVIEYFHIECGRHEVMFADGLPVETYRHDPANPENFESPRDRCDAGLLRMDAYAPVLGYWTIRSDAIGLLRSIFSTVFDLRDPIQIAYDRIATRAKEVFASV